MSYEVTDFTPGQALLAEGTYTPRVTLTGEGGQQPLDFNGR